MIGVPGPFPAVSTINANTGQQGPLAAYTYRLPGTYTITLTSRGWNGTEMITATTTALATPSQTAVKKLTTGTTGTFKIRVEKGVKPARSASFPNYTGLCRLFRPAGGHTALPGASTAFCMFGWFQVPGEPNLNQLLPGIFRNTAGNQTMRLEYVGATGNVRAVVGGTSVLSASTAGGFGNHS